MSSRRVALLSLTAALLVACGGTTEPDDDSGSGPLKVTLFQGADVPSIYTEDNIAIAACAVVFQAHTTSHATFTWRQMRLTFYRDSAMTVPFDTVVVGGGDLQSSWDGTLENGNEPLSQWSISASILFVAKAEFFYTADGRQEHSDPVRVPCTLPMNASAGPPVLSDLALTTSNGLITPPDPVGVHFTLSAPAGSWQGIIELSGTTCDTVIAFANPVAPDIIFERDIPVPGSCSASDSLALDVAFSDIRGQFTHERVAIATFTPDDEAPKVGIWFASELGERYVGDTLELYLAASDNRALTWLVWEVTPAGTRDSVPLSGTGTNLTFRLGMRPEWVGVPSLKFRFFSRDDEGHESPPLTVPGTLGVYPTNQPLSSVNRTIPGDVRRGVIDGKRDRVYLLEGNTARLTVLTASTLADVTTLPSYGMYGIDFSPSGDSLILASGGRPLIGIIDLTAPVLAIDTFSFALTGTAPFALGSSVHALNNGKVYVSDGEVQVVEVDLATHAARVLPGGARAFLARAGNGSRAVATTGSQMTLYDATTGFGAAVTEPWTDHVRMNLDGSRTAVGLKIFDGNLGLLRTVSGFSYNLANTPRIALSSDGVDLYHTDYGSHIVHGSTVTGHPVERYTMPFARAFECVLSLSGDGTLLLYSEVKYGDASRVLVLRLH